MNGSAFCSCVVIFTTAGLTRAAASMTADDSSMVTGCRAPVCWEPLATAAGAGRSKAPVRSRTATVPTEATVADSSDAATIVPSPAPLRRCGCTGWTGVDAASPQPGGGVPPPATGAPQAAGAAAGSAAVPVGPGVPLGEDGQRSGGSPPGAHAQRASGRGSGAGA